MMNFDEFLEAAKGRVQETIPDAEVKIQQVNKLQGESYTGISVPNKCLPRSRPSPSQTSQTIPRPRTIS